MGNSVSRSADYNVAAEGSRELTFTIPVGLAGLRLDQALARLLPGESRSRLARLIGEGLVRVDGAAVPGKRKLTSGELVEVRLAPRVEASAFRPEAIALDIVHEDADVLVVNKPAGLVVHPGSGNWAGTMLNALLHRAPELEHLARAGIVHRLDKDTSGLLVVARNEPAQLALVKALAAHEVKRKYLALVRGKVEGSGKVEAPIGRHPVHRTRMAVVAGGKPAVTHYRVRKRFAAHTLLECDLETGRTHQIRVHLASLGHPIEGDPVYAGRAKAIFGRQALHAWKLSFAHPRTGKAMAFEAELPEDFRALVAGLGK
jgi:23S rRNA pseudouridine1911/1915/1917 synthase